MSPVKRTAYRPTMWWRSETNLKLKFQRDLHSSSFHDLSWLSDSYSKVFCFVYNHHVGVRFRGGTFQLGVIKLPKMTEHSHTFIRPLESLSSRFKDSRDIFKHSEGETATSSGYFLYYTVFFSSASR